MLGSHGVGDVNDVDHRLLTLMACPQLTVCNTLFPKKRIHMYTWQHPGSQKWHCIDYVFVRQQHRKRCMDCQVMRAAQCSTDHRLVRLKYRLPDVVQQPYHHDARSRPRNFGVHHFNRKPFTSEEEAESVPTVRVEYCASLESRLSTYDRASSVDCNWCRVLLTRRSRWLVGTSGGCQIGSVTMPLYWSLYWSLVNTLYIQWLRSGRHSDHRAFKEALGWARASIPEDKNTPADGQSGGGAPCTFQWQSCLVCHSRHATLLWGLATPVRQIHPQCGWSSLRICSGAAVHMAWAFLGCLECLQSVRRDPHVFQLIPQREVEDSLSLPPSEDELTQAIRHLQNGKAGGMSEIVPELLKVGVPVLHQLLLDLL